MLGGIEAFAFFINVDPEPNRGVDALRNDVRRYEREHHDKAVGEDLLNEQTSSAALEETGFKVSSTKRGRRGEEANEDAAE